MSLTEVAFHYRKVVLLLLASLLIYGVVSYFTLPAQEDPKIVIREALVTTSFPGLDPERVELLITKTLEEKIRQIPEIKEIRSTSSTGLSVIHVEIEDRYFNLKDIWQNLRNKVQEAQSALPNGSSTPFINDQFGDVAVVTLALTADGFEMGKMFDVAKHIRDTLYSVKGTNKIEILGVQEERIFMETSNAKLAQIGITPQQLINLLQAQNIIQPGGEVDTGAKTYIVEPTGNFESIKDIGNTLVSIPNTTNVIPLKDIVTIKRAYRDPPFQPSYFNGKQAIIFAISMLDKYNVLEYSPRLKTNIQQIENTLPVGYKLDIVTYQAEQVANTVYGVSISVLQTLVIVLIVVVIFLGLRTGLIVGVIVPFVMLVTLAIMNLVGIDLQRMSLATLIISLGLLVDNGIVMGEDFKRRLEEGIDRFEALKQGGRELAIPLLTSSLTTIVVFMPLMLAEHVAGEYTRSISQVIMITLLISWVMALCVTPILSYYFLKVNISSADNKANAPASSGIFSNTYKGLLKIILRFRIAFIGLMFGLLILSFMGMAFVSQQFFPDSDRTQLLVNIQMPAGSSSRTMNDRIQAISKWLDDKKNFPHIKSFAAYVGYGGPRFVLSLSPDDPADNKSFIVLNIDDKNNIEKTAADLRHGFIKEFPDLFVRVKKMFLGPSDSSAIEIQVQGPDADFIFAKAQEIKEILRQVPGTRDIRDNWENRITKILVKVDQNRARRASVTSQDIANTLQAYFSGSNITEFREGDDIIPILFRADAAERFNLDRLRTINVYSSSLGVNVPLFQIADFAPVNQYSNIQRKNLFRTISIEGLNPRFSAEDLKKIIDPKIEALKKDLPENHQIDYSGVISDSQEAQVALSANVPLAIGVIIILIVIQFNSYRRAGIILLTIPLAFIGAVVGLIVLGAPFGFVATLGLYSLAGIIINNAIVLIDRIDIERSSGKTPYDAIVNACLVRLRPITMATITTILGLLPLLLSRDPLFYGMAAAMAFGLGVGTVLTLGVTPVLYSLFFNIRKEA